MVCGRTRSLGIAAALLLMMAPTAAATTPVATGSDGVVEPNPVDAVLEVLNLTLAYVEDFDPNDNATTMKEKTKDLVNELLELADFLCLDFDLGVEFPSVGINQIFVGILEIRVPAYGHDDEVDKKGPGMLTIEVDTWGGCASFLKRPGLPVELEAPHLEWIKQEIEGVMRSAGMYWKFSPPAASF